MKRLSRLVAAMVALALVLTGVVFAETQGTIAERYQDALSRLERYLMNLQDDSVNITTLAEDFQKLGNYEGSNAFYYYTLGLADTSANNYTLIPMYIDALVINTSFDERLTNLRANGVNIPSVAEWAAYLNGRVAENEGNYAEAAEQYQQCLNFMDAQNRILYALAWSRQTSAAATPAPTAAPTSAPNNANTTVTVYPPTLYANVSGKAVSLEWTTVSGATNYSLYRRRTNYDKNFQLIYSGSSLSYKDTSANANYNYTYYVAATTKEGRQLSSNEKTALISSNSASNNTSTTTTKPPVTNPPVTKPPVTKQPVTNPPVTSRRLRKDLRLRLQRRRPRRRSGLHGRSGLPPRSAAVLPVRWKRRWRRKRTRFLCTITPAGTTITQVTTNGTIPMLSIRVPTISRVLEIGNT